MGKVQSEPVLVTGAVQAILGLLLAFGVKLSQEQVGAILAATAALLALLLRGKVTPTNRGGE